MGKQTCSLKLKNKKCLIMKDKTKMENINEQKKIVIDDISNQHRERFKDQF